MKLTSRQIVVALALVAAAAVSYYVIDNGLLSPDDSNEIPAGIAYGNGRIEAVQVDVATKIPGRLKEITVEEGDLVQPGQTLAVIDSAQLRAQLLRAQADIASAESQVASADATIAQARAQLKLAEKELARSAKLIKQGHTSQEAYDTQVSQRDVAVANVRAAVAARTSRLRGVDAARATEQEIQAQIDDATLVAPVFGRVLYRLAEPGEVITSGGKVVTLINLDNLYMEFFLPSAQAHRISIGSEARIKLDIVDFAIPATVSFVSPESQFTPKQVETLDERDKLMFRVKVRIPSALVHKHIDQVKTGVRGVAYVRLNSDSPPQWPAFLQKLPPDALELINSK